MSLGHKDCIAATIGYPRPEYQNASGLLTSAKLSLCIGQIVQKLRLKPANFPDLLNYRAHQTRLLFMFQYSVCLFNQFQNAYQLCKSRMNN